MELKAKWIATEKEYGDICPVFRKKFQPKKSVKHANFAVTARGVYEAQINGKRVGDFILAPGWTAYEKRLQVQTYDVTELILEENELSVLLGKGWYRSPMPGWVEDEEKKARASRDGGILAELTIIYTDGEQEIIGTDESWECGESAVRFSEIYDGECFDAGFETKDWECVKLLAEDQENLIPQEGEEVHEMERVSAKQILHTPAGETLVDFGQEVTGYVEFCVQAEKGDIVRFRHGEVLDKNGNFYCENYRSAKAEVQYICKEGFQKYHPKLTFFGFRYLKLEEFPGTPKPEQFQAVVVHSDIRRTGYLRCSNPKLNQLFSNIIWGQRDNFLDVPTDCPQRDERLGWTGDAQVFVKTAGYNFDVEKFFRKWLHDLAADQREDGSVGQVIPDYLPNDLPSAAWGDAAVICPWWIYQIYGDRQVLADQFESMKRWVDYITGSTTPYLWTGARHCFGDWLGLDAPSGSYKGSSREDLIQSAFYAYSTSLLVKAGKVLGKDMTEYETLERKIKEAFQQQFSEYHTQTEHVLAIHFGLASDLQKTADALAQMIEKDGVQLKTGFVGTPYLLHALSDYGHADLAYSLLLRESYPSWLFSVNQGATTVWEHWDGVREDGSFWSSDMNSFNHYAYGSVADWVYEKAAGIQMIEDAPGFAKVRIAPHPDVRLEWLEAELMTRHGKIRSCWKREGEYFRVEIKVPVEAEVMLAGKTRQVPAGRYTFWQPVEDRKGYSSQVPCEL